MATLPTFGRMYNFFFINIQLYAVLGVLIAGMQ